MNERRIGLLGVCAAGWLLLSVGLAFAQTPGSSSDAGIDARLRSLLRDQGSDVMVVDRIVAWVDNEAITLGEVEEALSEYQSSGDVSSGPPTLPRLREALAPMIDDRLILRAAERAGIDVPAEAADNRVDALIRRMSEVQGGEDALEAVLRRAGRSVASLRDQLREQTRRDWTIAQAVNGRFSIGDDEVARFEQERERQGEPTRRYYLSHLFFPLSPSAPEEVWQEAMTQAHDARIEAERRGDFAGVAAEWARRLADRDVQGGPLGSITPSEMLPELAVAARDLEPGQSSAPVRTGKGVHVLYMERKTTAREILHAQRYDQEKARWAGQLRLEATIRILDPDLRTERVPTFSSKKPALAADE
ncbi:peptidylprolyl isomerase [Candidatus Sumerlaeota bacterium]|nr:peptidylprolyl isomerase [Candidatus Sumerlaeota bacterium]